MPDLYRPQSLNRYSYTEGDPANHRDPSGHMRMQVELRKEQAALSPFGWMYHRTLESSCGGAFAYRCVRAAPGTLLEET